MKRNVKLKEAKDNAEAFVAQMKEMDDKKLSKHLDLFHQQMTMAWQQQNTTAYELLYEYEKQTIIARAGKVENK